MSLGISANELSRIAISILLIAENIEKVIPNYETFIKVLAIDNIESNRLSFIRSQYNSFNKNNLIWWTNQSYELQSYILEMCLNYRNQAKKKQAEMERLSD